MGFFYEKEYALVNDEVVDCWEDLFEEEDLFADEVELNVTKFKINLPKPLPKWKCVNLKKEEEVKEEEVKVEVSYTPVQEKLNWLTNPILNPKPSEIKTIMKQTVKREKKERKKSKEKEATITNMVLHQPSLIAEKKNGGVYVKRCDAFDTLVDKDKMAQKFEKTRMCKSIEDKTRCPHGARCKFAHSLDELNIRDCLFDGNCNLVEVRDGKCLNKSKTKKCSFKHSCEEKEDYYYRVGLKTRQQVRAQVVVIPPPPKKIEKWTDVVSRGPTECLIRASTKEEAMEKMWRELEKGKKNIKVEIV